MMKLIRQIRDVEQTSILENKFIYQTDNKILEITAEESVLILDKVYDYYNKDNFIYYQKNNLESLYRFDNQNGEVKELQGVFSLRGSFDTTKESLYTLGRQDNNKVFFKINIKDYSIKEVIPYSTGLPLLFNENFCIVKYKNTLTTYASLFKDELWQHTLPEGFKIFGSIQAIDDVLFFIAYKDNHYQLVTGLDIETGTVLYQNQYEVTNERKFISAHAYNPLDKLFYGLGDVYQIFNPKTGEIVLEKTVEECESKVIRPYVNSIYENKLWFISGKYEDVKFGCLDLDTQEVEFIQDFPQENDEMFEAPIYHENKLYLKGIHYNQLYVFE